jgi:glycosyltransferase involved in cell wall biosynthesis
MGRVKARSSDAPDSSPRDDRRTGCIGYVLQMYPVLTETFVYREVEGLRRKGLQVKTFAFREPDPEDLSRESRHLMQETRYVLPLRWRRFLASHLVWILRRPLRYLGTLAFVLTRRGESPRNRLLTLFHFGAGVDLAGAMRREGVTHVHAHFTINAATMALVIARLLDVPFSFTAHNLMFRRPLLLKAKLREAAFVVAISEFSRRFLVDSLPGEGIDRKIHVVHCGVSPRDFSPRRSRPRHDVPVLVFVAQLAERKGAPVLVRACRILADRGVRFRCVLVGDGPERDVVDRLVSEHRLEDSITRTGAVPQENLRDHLDRADVFVLPCVRARDGDMDGIPVSMMEAMAMEIPTVSTRVSGIPELVEDGESGLLVEAGDPEALADALERVLGDADLRVRLGRAGRRRVIEAFDVDRSASELAELFDRQGRPVEGS